MSLKNKIDIPKNTTFLVLDDLESFRKAGIENLKALGMEGPFLEAEDVQEAIEVLQNNNIEFVLSDWNLPDGTGLQLLEKVRSTEKYKEIPFLMITTENEISNVLQAVNSGASNYLVKPWDAKGFLEALTAAWDKHSS